METHITVQEPTNTTRTCGDRNLKLIRLAGTQNKLPV